MIEELVKFKTSRGLKLSGILLAPDEKLRDVVVFAHGTGSDKYSPRNRGIADNLVKAGLSAFLFDFTGHGDSDGIAEQSTQDQQVNDLSSAIDFLDSQNLVQTRFVGVNGSSTGGTVALHVASEDPRVQVLVVRVPRIYEIAEFVPLIQAPTRIIQGSEDTLIMPEAREIYDGLICTKDFYVIEGAGHLFGEKPEYTQEMSDATCSWFIRWFAELERSV